MKYLPIIAALVVTPVLAQQGKLAQPTGGISLKATDWQFFFSNNMPTNPTALPSGTGWSFNFPTYDGSPDNCGVSVICPSVNYLTTRFTSLAGGYVTMAVQAVASAGATYEYKTNPDNTCVTPAHVRAYLERYKYSNSDEFGRYWSNPIAYDLTVGGQMVVRTPVTSDQWSDVNGQLGSANPNKFSDFLSHLGRVGMTFGGGCFFGHGVFVSGGSATFTLTNYSIGP